MMREDYSYLFKILLIGDSGVGKSSLLTRYVEDFFEENYRSTIGVNFLVRTIKIEGKSVKLQAWDTAGQERFRAVTACCFRGADGVLIVYDTTKEGSFEHVEHWLSEIEKNAPTAVKLLVGNKCDLGMLRAVESKRAETFAAQQGMEFLETSAKDRTNVDQAFLQMATNLKHGREARGTRGDKFGTTSKSSTFRVGSTQVIERTPPSRSSCLGKSKKC